MSMTSPSAFRTLGISIQSPRLDHVVGHELQAPATKPRIASLKTSNKTAEKAPSPPKNTTGDFADA